MIQTKNGKFLEKPGGFKNQIHPLVVERAYLATTACSAQGNF
jgi:hypothetical protein